MRSRFQEIIAIAIVAMAIQTGAGKAQAFDSKDWSVRCWDFDEKRRGDLGIDKMTLTKADGVTKITNTSGIHKHAHFVFPTELKGDFVFTIEVKGGYELGFLNRSGKDEMLYLEVGESEKFETYELSRNGTRFTILRNGRAVPLVHFRFDYGEEFVITLAIKDGEAAEVRSYSLETGE